MKFLILFILGFGIFYMLRRSLAAKRQQNQKPPMRTVTEATAAQQPIAHKENHKH